MLKILADENVHAAIVMELRNSGQTVSTVPDVGLAGSSDEVILEYAITHRMLLLSGDKDFGGLMEFGALWGRGKVVLLRHRSMNIPRIVRNILDVFSHEINLLKNEKSYLIVLAESGYRIHRYGN